MPRRPWTCQPSVKRTSSRGTTATSSSGSPSGPITTSPSTAGMKPAATYWLWPVPEPKLHAPVSRYPPSTNVPVPLGKNCPPIVTGPAKTSAKPSSGR